MTKNHLLAATAALAFALFPMQTKAADIEAPTAYDWTGPYIGLQAGYAWAKVDGALNVPEGSNIIAQFGDVAEDAGDVDTKGDGFIGGLTLGWNHQSDNLVLGIEGDVSFLDVDGTGDGEATDLGFDVRVRDKLQADVLATLRLRAGLAFDQTLLYVTGGGAYADAKIKRDVDWNGGDGCPPVGGGLELCHSGDADFDWGWTIGGGIEHAFDANWSVKAEYLYVDFGNEDFTSTSVVVQDQTLKHSFDLDMHIVRVGVNYRF
jgi:outer membrane immunogenic protein